MQCTKLLSRACSKKLDFVYVLNDVHLAFVIYTFGKFILNDQQTENMQHKIIKSAKKCTDNTNLIGTSAGAEITKFIFS